jgi:hypothetical protein
MNGNWQLLDEVLQEDRPSDDIGLTEMLRSVRRRRRGQIAVRVTAILLALAVIIPALFRGNRPVPGADSVAKTDRLPSAPPSLAVVETRSGPITIISSIPGSVSVIETRTAHVDRITDERLLALLDRPAAIVWRSALDAELVFTDSSGGYSEWNDR